MAKPVVDKSGTNALVYGLRRKLFNARTFKNLLISIFNAVIIFGISFIILYPILMKISIAFKDKIDIYNSTVVWIPRHLTLDNFSIVLKMMDYPKVLLNSFLVSGGTMILQTLTCAIVGYGFARLKFRGSSLLFAGVIFTILVPPQTIMIPSYLHFQKFDVFGLFELVLGKPLNLINTYWPLLLSSLLGVGLKNGLYIYIFRQSFRGMPKEVEEAAFVDGAGIFTTFIRVMMPIAIPVITTVMLFSFVWQWNDTFYTSMYLGTAELMSIKLSTVAPSIGSYLTMVTGVQSDNNQVDPFYLSMLVNTSVLLAILPLILLYLFVQKNFVESVERTGLVG